MNNKENSEKISKFGRGLALVVGLPSLAVFFNILVFGIPGEIQKNAIEKFSSQPIYQKNIEGKNYIKQDGNVYIQINDTTYNLLNKLQLKEFNNQEKNLQDKLH